MKQYQLMWLYTMPPAIAQMNESSAKLNRMASQGWRLIAVDNGVAVFERDIAESGGGGRRVGPTMVRRRVIEKADADV